MNNYKKDQLKEQYIALSLMVWYNLLVSWWGGANAARYVNNIEDVGVNPALTNLRHII